MSNKEMNKHERNSDDFSKITQNTFNLYMSLEFLCSLCHICLLFWMKYDYRFKYLYFPNDLQENIFLENS